MIFPLTVPLATNKPQGAPVSRSTQDDVREQLQLESFGLTPIGKGRSNKYIPDATADGFDVQIELKSSDIEKGLISTCREFGLKKLSEYKKVVFIFSQYEKAEGKTKLLKHVFCTPQQLSPFFDKVEARIRQPSERCIFGGLNEWEEAKKHLLQSGFCGNMSRLDNTFERGTRQNDPRIKWKDVEQWGTVLDASKPRQHLNELLTKYTKENNG